MSSTEPSPTHDPSYFEDMYRDDPDPWGFDDRWYERRKHDLTVAALPRPRYRRAFEPGCANGALTERLAGRCEQVVAVDLVRECVERARTRLAGRPGVEVRRAHFPDHWPDGSGDLVVWSEIAYYLHPVGRRVAETKLAGWLEPGGTLIAVHYTGDTNYPMSGEVTHEWIGSWRWLRERARLLDHGFEIVVWERS